ncbi:MAG: carbohydrate kinase family protein [Bacteroides xylanisolvens]
MSKIIVGLGEILWDVFPKRKVLGGAPANFAYHASQFGFNSYAVSAIGNDASGKEIQDSINEKNFNSLLEIVDSPTGIVKVELDNKGVPSYEIVEGVAWDNIPFSNAMAQLASKTSAACFGSLAQRAEASRKTIRKFLSCMPEGSLKIFDINLRQHYYTKNIIEESFELANMAKINDDEIKIVAEMLNIDGNEENACKFILNKYQLDVIILTKGTEGSLVMTPEITSFQETYRVQVADTVGAGDSFTAAFIAAYMHNKPIAEAHKLAVEVSAYVCLQHGAMPKLADAYLELFL